MTDDRLVRAAANVDVIDAAGRIIANPRRNAIAASAAEVLALAHAAERFWAVALEADLLVRALKLPAGELRTCAIERQAREVETLMAAIRGETNASEGDIHANRDH